MTALKRKANKQSSKSAGRPPKYATPEELDNKICEYFELKTSKPITVEKDGAIIAVTDKHGNVAYTKEKPTLSGLSVFLGFADRQSLYDQMQRGDDFSCVIKKAVTLISVFHEENLFEASCTGSIFWLKVHGWDDKNKDEAKDETIARLLAIAERLTGTNGNP